MITIRRSEERGHANHGWLDTYHTFSFADYRAPEFNGFSVLRVLNQDRVEPGQGFGTHEHKDMEIVSQLLAGTLEHKDSMGPGSRMRPGEVQLMSAGTGVTHSEFNGSEDAELHFLQMWVIPAELGTKPRYEQKEFPETERREKLQLVASPDGREGSLTFGQNVCLYTGLHDGREVISHELAQGRCAWLHVARGKLVLNGKKLGPGDGAGIRDEPTLTLQDGIACEFVLWDLPQD